MSLETRKAVAKKYRDGFYQADPVAKLWAEEFYPLESVKQKKKEKADNTEMSQGL